MRELTESGQGLYENRQMDDWDPLRYVLAIDRHGGLSGAARALGVTHATVSRNLAKAEAALGQRLFDRLPGGLTPTDAGRAAAARAAAMEAEVAGLGLSLAGREEGPLAITAPPLMLRGHLAADLAALAAAHPAMRLSVLSDNRVLDLHRREADIAVRVARAPAESLWGRRVASQRAGYFATAEVIAAHGPALAGAGGPAPLISFAGWPAPTPRDLALRLKDVRVAAVCDDMPAAIELARAGLGLVRLPFAAARAEPALRLVETLPTLDYAPVWLLTHPDLRRAPLVRLAMTFLADGFAAASADYLRPPERSVTKAV